MNKTELAKLAITISAGDHETPQDGMCIMECAAYMAGEDHSDQPVCASPLVGPFAIRVNDRCGDEQRNTLINFVLRLVNSRADRKTEWKRAYMAADYAIRKFLAATFEHEGLKEHAEMFRGLDQIMDIPTTLDAARAVKRIERELTEGQRRRGQLAHALSCASSVLLAIAEGGVFLSKWQQTSAEAQSLYMSNVYGCGIFEEFHATVDEFGFMAIDPINYAKEAEILFPLRYELLDEMLKLTDDKELMPEAIALPKLRELEELTNA